MKNNLLEKYLNNENVLISQNNELYTIKYKHGGVDFSDELLRNCRGLTLDNNGNVITRGFQKFFNYKQLEDYEDYTEDFKEKFSRGIPKNKKITAIEKLDGTLILLSVYKDNFIVSTTSSTNTEYSEKALVYFNNLENKKEIKEYITNNNITLAFEYTSPNNLIVVRYKEEKYTLIGIHENITGKRFTQQETDVVAKQLNFNRPKYLITTLNELILLQQNEKDSEGYVIENIYNNLIKFKTEDWFKIKNETTDIFFSSNITKRKINLVVKAYIEDTIDDLLALENQIEAYKKNAVVKTIFQEIKNIENEIEYYYNQTIHLSDSELNVYCKENNIKWISYYIYSIRQNKDWKRIEKLQKIVETKLKSNLQ